MAASPKTDAEADFDTAWHYGGGAVGGPRRDARTARATPGQASSGPGGQAAYYEVRLDDLDMIRQALEELRMRARITCDNAAASRVEAERTTRERWEIVSKVEAARTKNAELLK